MTIKHLSSNRIQGTEADRLLGESVTAGWRVLHKQTTFNWNWQYAHALPDYRYYMIICSSHGAVGANQIYFRINPTTNSSTEANGELKYTNRDMYDFGDGSDTQVGSSRHGILLGKHAGTTDEIFSVGYLSNPVGAEKLYTGSCVNSNQQGAYAPHGFEMAGKYIGTGKVNSIQFRRNNGTADSGTEDVRFGTEFVVLGWTDKLTATKTDAHTDNFWKELSTTYGNGTTRVSSNKFGHYKYLWFQFMGRHTSGNGSTRLRFNYDEGSDYAKRSQHNGTGTPQDRVNQTSIDDGGSQSQAEFMNGFICNIGGIDKLVLLNQAKSDVAGANDIVRIADYGKWQGTGALTNNVETHTPITSIQVDSSSAAFHADSILKVWGADM